MRSPQTPNVWPKLCQSSWGTGDGWPFLFLQSVRHTHLSETAVKSEDGEEEGRADGRSRRAGQLRKLRVRRPQEFRCVGVGVRAHTPGRRASAC